MASFSLVVEDSSPLISYSPAGAWVDTTNDTLATSYSGSSLHTTNTRGAAATFTFNGTGVSIFGGRRPGYGTYTFVVDGQASSVGNAESPTPTTKQLLASISGLPFDTHTVVLESNGGGILDLDWIEMETQVGTSGSQLSTKTVDDTDPQLTYLPSPEAWQVNTGSAFMGNSLHFTSQQGTAASMNFDGEAIALYGTVSPDHADVRVSIDGQEAQLSGGSRGSSSTLHTQVLLYYSDNLGPGQHNLVLSADSQTSAAPFIDLDSISIFASTSAPGSDGNAAAPAGSHKPSPEFVGTSMKSVPMKAIVAATIGGVLALLCVLGLVLLLLRRRKAQTMPVSGPSPTSPDLPMQKTPIMMEAGYLRAKPALNFEQTVSRPSIALSYYGVGTDSQSGSRAPSRASSNGSTAPMLVQQVPLLGVPQPPKRAMTRGDGRPQRPSQRPPTMTFLG